MGWTEADHSSITCFQDRIKPKIRSGLHSMDYDIFNTLSFGDKVTSTNFFMLTNSYKYHWLISLNTYYWIRVLFGSTINSSSIYEESFSTRLTSYSYLCFLLFLRFKKANFHAKIFGFFYFYVSPRAYNYLKQLQRSLLSVIIKCYCKLWVIFFLNIKDPPQIHHLHSFSFLTFE